MGKRAEITVDAIFWLAAQAELSLVALMMIEALDVAIGHATRISFHTNASLLTFAHICPIDHISSSFVNVTVIEVAPLLVVPDFIVTWFALEVVQEQVLHELA